MGHNGEGLLVLLGARTVIYSQSYLYRKYFFRIVSYVNKSAFQLATIFSGAAPSCNCFTVPALPSRVSVFAKSTLSGYSFFNTAAISNPIRMERTADFFPIFMLTPPHR